MDMNHSYPSLFSSRFHPLCVKMCSSFFTHNNNISLSSSSSHRLVMMICAVSFSSRDDQTLPSFCKKFPNSRILFLISLSTFLSFPFLFSFFFHSFSCSPRFVIGWDWAMEFWRERKENNCPAIMPLMLPLVLHIHTLLYPHDSKDTSRDEEMGRRRRCLWGEENVMWHLSSREWEREMGCHAWMSSLRRKNKKMRERKRDKRIRWTVIGFPCCPGEGDANAKWICFLALLWVAERNCLYFFRTFSRFRRRNRCYTGKWALKWGEWTWEKKEKVLITEG